jgi:hypothetical protein
MQIETYQNSQLFKTTREVKKWGRDWIVVNGVPIVEGVLKNVFVPMSEFGAFVKDWNDVPLVLRHPDPSKNDGAAKTPDVDVPVIGRFYNAKLDEANKRLIGEFWLDKVVLDSLDDGKSILNAIKNNRQVEVSTGYHAMIELKSGKHGDKKYSGIHRNLHPDHIAILPDQTGACSVKDGCGINRNSADAETIINSCQCQKGNSAMKNNLDPIREETVFHINMSSKGMSLDEQAQAIREAFRESVRPKTANIANPSIKLDGAWVRDVYSDHVIAEMGGKLYRAEFTRTEDGSITFNARNTWQEVVFKKSYVDVQNMAGNLPAKAAKVYESVFKSAKDDGDDDATAGKKAWGAVKKAGWRKVGEEWKMESNSSEYVLAKLFSAAGYKTIIVNSSNTSEDK